MGIWIVEELACPACEDGYICLHGDGCLLDEMAARAAFELAVLDLLALAFLLDRQER